MECPMKTALPFFLLCTLAHGAACLPGYWLIRRLTVGQITDVWMVSYYVLLAALAIYLV